MQPFVRRAVEHAERADCPLVLPVPAIRDRRSRDGQNFMVLTLFCKFIEI